jgi:zinc transporter 1/2/3
VAIGIHAIFEGLAIGIETEPVKALSIALAVVCHKWAEGLTLGLAFKKAGVDIKTSTIMILIQAIMNPVGVAIGWILSDEGNLVTGIFMSISAGTFVYIATLEVLVEEFNVKRYKIMKYIFFLIAIGFISSLWFLE